MASLEGWGFTIKLYPRVRPKCRDLPSLRQGFSREIKKNLTTSGDPIFMGPRLFLRFYCTRNKIPIYPCRRAGVVQW